MTGPAVHVFTGPTLSGEDVAVAAPHAVVHPPVAHGDLLRLDVAPGDVVVVVDGYYHQRAPVRHKEVLELVDRGVRVVGCGSMGALRAAELAAYGMIGFGRVYEMYRDGEIDADDEVAVAHLPGGSFEARNVPLVNVRHAVAEAAAAGVVTAERAATVVATAKALHYTERSWRYIGASHAETGDRDTVPTLVAHLQEHPEAADLKRNDALGALGDLARIVADAGEPEPLGHWRNRHVYQWLAEFAGRDDAEDPVSDADVLRHQQLYQYDFPALWRAFVVAQAGGPGAPGDPATLAADVFARAGATEQALSADNPYLTKQELADLDPPESLVRTLVRSYVPPRGLHDVLAVVQPPADADDVRRGIRAARELNDTTLWRKRVRLVERLSPDRLERHLEGLWDVPPGDHEHLLAAARDRGFAMLADAVSAVRPYFLRDDTRSGGSVAPRWDRA